jgi:hypothetical protein
MNAKEKATQITNLFKNVRIYISQEPTDNDAIKDCAVIAIDLIIESINKSGEYSAKSQIEWWNRVKAEL